MSGFFTPTIDKVSYTPYICIIKNNITMGQIKRLLDELFEVENYVFSDDTDMDYKSIQDKQYEAEYSAYEEMLADSK